MHLDILNVTKRNFSTECRYRSRKTSLPSPRYYRIVFTNYRPHGITVKFSPIPAEITVYRGIIAFPVTRSSSISHFSGITQSQYSQYITCTAFKQLAQHGGNRQNAAGIFVVQFCNDVM